MSLKIGALFAGYGGLDMAVADVFGAEVAWYAEVDGLPKGKRQHNVGACAILEHRYPGVPNVGDVTKADWSTLERVDFITGGSPCQDLSHAGKRGGMTTGTRSNLWVAMREAIARLEPSYVVWENVRGAYSATADSDLEPCPGCMGDGSDGPHLRALGRVLGDLSELGYDVRWHGLRAADVGAAHGRFRVFALGIRRGLSLPPVLPSRLGVLTGPEVPTIPTPAAHNAKRPVRAREDYRGNLEEWAGYHDAETLDLLPTPRIGGTQHPERSLDARGGRPRTHLPTGVAHALLPTPDAYQGSRGGSQHPDKRRAGGHSVSLADTAEHALLPTPKATNNENRASEGRFGPGVGYVVVNELLPTPAVNDMGEGKEPEAWDEWTAEQKAAHGNGNGHGKSLSIEARRLLPTPSTQDDQHYPDNRGARLEQGRQLMLGHALPDHGTWGPYAPAIARWEAVIGRPAPAPTIALEGRKGTRRALNPAFVEWLMGLPEGWVTDCPNVTRAHALHALGNGVVPQQAAHALRILAGLPDELVNPLTHQPTPGVPA